MSLTRAFPDAALSDSVVENNVQIIGIGQRQGKSGTREYKATVEMNTWVLLPRHVL